MTRSLAYPALPPPRLSLPPDRRAAAALPIRAHLSAGAVVSGVLGLSIRVATLPIRAHLSALPSQPPLASLTFAPALVRPSSRRGQRRPHSPRQLHGAGTRRLLDRSRT